MKRIMLGFLLALCWWAPMAPASPPESNALPVLPAEGFQFAGKWDCEGTFRNNQVHKSLYTGEVVLGGKWLELSEQDTQPATGYLAKYLIGYDPQQKRLIEFDANNFGAATYSSDEGWKNGVLTMTSPISQDAKTAYAANRFVYSVAEKDAFTIDWQISRTATLNWIVADHLSCKRRSHG
jgi:hypothetical protein